DVWWEVRESMSVDGGTRVGAGSLMGDAKVGTPLCPDGLISLLIENGLIGGSIPCNLVAYGEDRINMQTGAGTLTARVSVTIEMDNPVDAPEFVVMTGRIEGVMQAIDLKNRLIAMSGTWTPQSARPPGSGSGRRPAGPLAGPAGQAVHGQGPATLRHRRGRQAPQAAAQRAGLLPRRRRQADPGPRQGGVPGHGRGQVRARLPERA